MGGARIGYDRGVPVSPTGTVTFLFTDIEGSTRLWEHHHEAMQADLALHDETLRTAMQEHGGYVFKTVGDAFCVAFETASQAVAAALNAQLALGAAQWAVPNGIRVRMGLHTGEAHERDGDYYGAALSRVSRLMGAGDGGQVLLSAAVQELVAESLPEGARLQSVGQHRLRDLSRAQELFQLTHEGLAAGLSRLHTLDSAPNNLPLQTTPLLGRVAELADLLARIRQPDVRILTLTGPGGTGKTRLALQVAADAIDDFEHGCFFVDLASVNDPRGVVPAIGVALQLHDLGGNTLDASALAASLAGRELLLVLDNFEQVIEAGVVVSQLAAGAARVKLIITTREALRLTGEQEFPVPQLSTPTDREVTPQQVSQYESVRLFIQRAQAVRPDFSVTDTNAPAVAEICVRLDGLPLAIELAASRIRALSPEALLHRLGDRLKLLAHGSRDRPSRQRTLRGAIDWSHSLLNEDEMKVFRRLCVFAGGCSLEAAESICDLDGDLDSDVLDVIMSLVEKNLVRHEDLQGSPRYSMLQTLTQYAREKLAAALETERALRRHAEWFRDLVVDFDVGDSYTVTIRRFGKRITVDDELLALCWLEAANLGAAWEHLVAAEDRESMVALAPRLSEFWFWVDENQSRTILEQALPWAADAPAGEFFAVTHKLAFYRWYDDKETGRELWRETVARLREAGDDRWRALSCFAAKLEAWRGGSPVVAREFASAVLEESSDGEDSVLALGVLAGVAVADGKQDAAAALLAQASTLAAALATDRAARDLTEVYSTMGLAGAVERALELALKAVHAGDVHAAREAYMAAAFASMRWSAYRGEASGYAPQPQDARAAIRYMRQSLTSGGVLIPLRVEMLAHAAELACRAGLPDLGARLAASLRRWGPAPGPRLREMMQGLEDAVRASGEQLTVKEREAASREGALMDMGEALQYFIDQTDQGE